MKYFKAQYSNTPIVQHPISAEVTPCHDLWEHN